MIISNTQKFIFLKVPKTAGESIVNALSEYTEKKYTNPDRGNHEKLDEILLDIPEVINYFKFTFVRNPWDLRVSRFHYLYQTELKEKPPEFKEWCMRKSNWWPRNQINWFTFENKIKVDYIGRFENLQDDFNIISKKIGISPQQLPFKNASTHKHYTEYYDDETREIVAEKYAKDIEMFGYEFGK